MCLPKPVGEDKYTFVHLLKESPILFIFLFQERIKRSQQFGFIYHTACAPQYFSVSEKHQRRHGLNAVLACCYAVLIYIHLDDVFLESSPEETKARRIKRGRDENAASPFICRVVELEQEKLDLQGKNARIVVGKDGKVYEQ